MNEQTPFPFDALGLGRKDIRSPSEMAGALGFTQIPGSRHNRDRDYAKDFPETTSMMVPAEMTLYSGDFLNGQYMQVAIGVSLKEPGQIWHQGNWILENNFLTWFREQGGNSELADVVRQLEEPGQKDRIRKQIMKQGGYNLVARIIQQAEALGYFESLRNGLTAEYEQGKAFAAEWLPRFLAEFPEYSLPRNCFLEEKRFYVARPTRGKGRTPAMMISLHPVPNTTNEGGIGFELGTMVIDESGNISGFHRRDNARLPSTNQYPLTWFRGKMAEAVQRAVTSRRQIREELGK